MGCGFGASNKGKLWKFSGFLRLDERKVSAQEIQNRRPICAFDRSARKLNKMEKAADKVRCAVYAQCWRDRDRT